jgi:hypothetical protein
MKTTKDTMKFITAKVLLSRMSFNMDAVKLSTEFATLTGMKTINKRKIAIANIFGAILCSFTFVGLKK